MNVYLTKTRWNILSLFLRNGGATNPAAVTVDLVRHRLGLTTHDATITLHRMMLHGILTRVGLEYRLTRLGARLRDEMKTKTIDEITFEITEQ